MKNKFELIVELTTELAEITEKVEKLDKFMKSDEYLEISIKQQELLIEQIDIMYDYMGCLGRRIQDLT